MVRPTVRDESVALHQLAAPYQTAAHDANVAEGKADGKGGHTSRRPARRAVACRLFVATVAAQVRVVGALLDTYGGEAEADLSPVNGGVAVVVVDACDPHAPPVEGVPSGAFGRPLAKDTRPGARPVALAM